MVEYGHETTQTIDGIFATFRPNEEQRGNRNKNVEGF